MFHAVSQRGGEKWRGLEDMRSFGNNVEKACLVN